MSTLRKIRGNTSSTLITIFLLVVITSLPAIFTTTTINRVYGQQPNQMNLTGAESSANIQNNTSEEKIIQVGDIVTLHTRCQVMVNLFCLFLAVLPA
jgi:uncharacterized membrane protein